MPKIRTTSPDTTPSILGRDLVDDEMRDKINEGQLNSGMRMYHPGSETELQLFELEVPPDTLIGQHAHLEDEIIYVVAGELRLGARILGVGASVYIPGNTLYSLRAGPEGLRFLNFRARRDMTYIAKDEFLAGRLATTEDQPASNQPAE
jgi:quercetin dioxygenase-like cupin family protein